MHKYFVIALVALLVAACGDAPTPQQAVPRNPPPPPDLPPPPGLVAEGAEWERLASGYTFSEGPAAALDGTVYYAEPIFAHLYKISEAGEITQLDRETQMTMGLVMGADGFIYACRNRAAQIVRYSTDGNYDVLLQGEMTPLRNSPASPGEFCNDLAVNAAGGIWFTDRLNGRVMYLDPDGEVRVVAEGWRPNGIVLSADRKMIAVTDSNESRLHAFAVGENGALTEVPDFFDAVRVVDLSEEDKRKFSSRSGADGMTVDSEGRFYLASFYGIQVFGPDGKYIGVVARPKAFVSNLTFGGKNFDWLYATGRTGLFRLKMQVQGVHW